jgi:hypothetical protein
MVRPGCCASAPACGSAASAAAASATRAKDGRDVVRIMGCLSNEVLGGIEARAMGSPPGADLGRLIQAPPRRVNRRGRGLHEAHAGVLQKPARGTA